MVADKEPICRLDLWRVSPCGRDRSIVIPQQLRGAALWTRCVGFKGSKKEPAKHKEKCRGFLHNYLPSYRYDISTQMHIIRLLGGGHISSIQSPEVYNIVTLKTKNLSQTEGIRENV